VTPLVVHHGHNRWASPVQVADLIDVDPAAKQAVRAYLPRFEFLLDDLSGVDEDQLRERPLTPLALVTLMLMKSAPGNPRITGRAAAVGRAAAGGAGPARRR
jgi:hypothetical protein